MSYYLITVCILNVMNKNNDVDENVRKDLLTTT